MNEDFPIQEMQKSNSWESKLFHDGRNRTEALMNTTGDEATETSPLMVHNLLNSLTDLGSLLPGEVERGAWLNSYLLAAGMNQIVEDELHPDPLLLGKAAKYLGQIREPLGSWVAHAALMARAAILALHSFRRQTRKLVQWQVELAALVKLLAKKVMYLEASLEPSREELAGIANALVEPVRHFPERIQDAILRLPSCYRSFDQHPDDLMRLAEMYFQRWPECSRPVVVVGVRTSGSYLGPLLGAALEVAGAQQVQVLTLRPGRRLTPSERNVLLAAVRQGGQILVTDDPPSTGNSLARTARDLEEAGVKPTKIVFLLQLFGSEDSLPDVLQGFQTILLPWEDWSLQSRLQKAAVLQNLRVLWKPAIRLEDIEQLPLPARRWDRGHAQARFRVQCHESENGRRFERQVLVKGVGLGYFGQHSLAVARALPGFVPKLYGFRDGLLYREWLPEEKRLVLEDDSQATAFIQATSAYIAARSQALVVPEDVSVRLFGQKPVWEAASDLLCRAFGSAWMLARPLLVDPLVKRLLRARFPSVVDGKLDQFRWFASQDDNGLVKIDSDERDFCNLDLYCYDPVYDLAGAALELPDNALVEQLRSAYKKLSGYEIDEERWLLYSLVHLWDQRRTQDGHDYGWTRGYSRAVQEYFGALYFADLELTGDGELCALDIDGVLETDLLGFPTLSPSSALALRALKQHSYRPVLATGRSLDDVRERCKAYRLSGGVAEYGAASYNHLTGETISLLTFDQSAALDQLRSALSEIPRLVLDSDYRFAVRAFRIDETGNRHGLDAFTISSAIQQAQVEGRIRSIPGESQTDFMVSGIDKASGLRMLARQLGGFRAREVGTTFALAVGDTFEDLPVLRLAELAVVPAHAAPVLQHFGVQTLSRPYQAGMSQAVSRLLGHQPGTCPACQGPRLAARSKLLLHLFATQETGRASMLWHALALAIGSFEL